ncbi:SUMF1/EgtB/PvdO family nonheme iron enzyme [Lentzea aerocolonigenes]|uniref:SUMF1/EgtB/PvdO family nonheme iron enzyme n=1 Tax=Lentzea aerocolonigenes TaxID=68170 RepID=UPI000A89DC4B|nr:SUMF1/EgtB/PvdO family nonheme iron enzyme [Lentzea aerocolonigenes]
MPEDDPGRPCRVFISYAHESDEHIEQVRDLYYVLRENGVDAKLDLLAAGRRQDWPLWMGEQVRMADYVVVVASAAYRKRAEGRSGPDEGRGVQWEARLIRDAYYADQLRLERFVPVVLPGQSVRGVPDFLGPNTTTIYHVQDFSLAGMQPLLRLLLSQPAEVEPPLGEPPVLGRRGRRTDLPVKAAPAPIDSPPMELRWEGVPPGEQPVLLVTDFAADVPQALLQVCGEARPDTWLAGEELQEPIGSNLPPGSLVVVDFSGVLPEQAFTSDLASRIDAVLAWAADNSHRVVIGLSRFVLAERDVERLGRRVQVVTATPLFSAHHRHRAEECERLLGRKLPFRAALFPLLSANSAVLPRAAAEILRTIPSWPALVNSSAPGQEEIGVALEIARRLTEVGFYEIAFRLESWCRTANRQRGLVELTADLRRNLEARGEDSIVGFVESIREVPAVVPFGALTAGTGAGKSTSLLIIEHAWSLPHEGDAGPRVPHHLPLLVPLAPDENVDLAGHVEATIAGHAFARGDGGARFMSACHTLVRRLGSVRALRRLFGSPLYLLLDDVDQLSAAGLNRLNTDLAKLRADDSRTGALLACRDERTARLLRISDVAIRELGEQQIRALVRQRGGHASLPGLLLANGTPVSRYLRNPQLLSLMCDLELTSADLADANLAMILQLYVTRWGEWGAVDRRGVEDWLAEAALELKVSGARRVKLGDSAAQDMIATGRVLGLLRPGDDPGVLEFRFEALRDYFAARQLARLAGVSDLATVIRRYLAGTDGWHDVLRILVALVDHAGVLQLAETLVRRGDLQLAHECVLELPDGGGRAGELTSAALVHRIDQTADPDTRTRLGHTLGRLDPRIWARSPVRNLVEVPRSELMDAFQIGRYPVTNTEFAEFVAQDGYTGREWWDQTGWRWIKEQEIRFPRYWLNSRFNLPNQPVTGVSFFEAAAYCRWLTSRHPDRVFRLPSAIEWDWAAHGQHQIFERALAIARGNQDQTATPRGRSAITRTIRQWFGRNGVPDIPPPIWLDAAESVALIEKVASSIEEYTVPQSRGLGAPVGGHPPNRLGAHDFFGAAWQWCNTSMSVMSATEQYLEEPPPAQTTAKGTLMVVKGGDTAESHNPVWSVIGGWFDPFVRYHRLGFRVSCWSTPRTRRAEEIGS